MLITTSTMANVPRGSLTPDTCSRLELCAAGFYDTITLAKLIPIHTILHETYSACVEQHRETNSKQCDNAKLGFVGLPRQHGSNSPSSSISYRTLVPDTQRTVSAAKRGFHMASQRASSSSQHDGVGRHPPNPASTS